MEEFETSVSHVQTEPQSREENIISAVEEGKTKEYIMLGREKRSKNRRKQASGIVPKNLKNV